MFDLINTSLFIVIGLHILLALFMIAKGKDKKISIAYVFVLLSVVCWIFSMIFYRASSPEDSLFYVTILYVVATFPASTFYVFSQIFPRGDFPSKTKLLVSIVLNVAIIYLVVSPNTIIKRVDSFPGQEKIIIWGKWYFLYVIYNIAFFSCGLLSLFKKYLKSIGPERLQILYVFLGYFFGSSLAMFTNLLMVWWGDFSLNWLGQIFALLMVGFTVYAIVRFRLMGIRILVSKVYMTLVVALSFYTLYYVIVFFDETFLGGLYTPAAIFIGIPVSIVIAVGTIPFLNYIQKSSDTIFFRGNNPRTIIKDLSIRISGVIELKQLIKILASEFRKIVGAEEVSIIFITQKNAQKDKQIKVCVAKNGKFKDKFIQPENSIYQIILNERKTVVKEELDKKKDKMLLSEMEHYNAKIVAPLEVRKKVVGIILLGEKITQDAYTKEDIEFLEIIGSQAAIAIENARLYKESRDFNARLKKEVQIATKEVHKTNGELIESNNKLTRAYEKLTKLDRAKSEFLSIASHQLRTPLTSIKGFTSLLLEGTYGKISKSVRATLEKIFISNERLIKLVEDLLNISRIESGRLAFDFKQDSIESLLEEIFDSMKIAAKNKNLVFKYKKPTKAIEPFVFDGGKLKEVVSNLIDNSIKYTKSGFVSVALEEKSNVIRIVVEDSGMGIRKGELEYIFERFQRGKDVNQVHTEGVGLGLYVCKKIIEAHKGRVWAESEGVEKGSRFVVELKKNLKPAKQAKKPEIFGK